MQIGLSTGCFYKFLNPVSKEAIKLARELGSNIIELNAQMPERLEFLDDITEADMAEFEYVSCHGLGHDVMIKLDASGHRKVLDYFQRLYERIHFNCLVLHPGAWIADWEIFNNYSFPIAFENMDWRHNVGADVKSLREILQNKKFQMVLDINHCYTHDKTMRRADELYGAFKDKITHYHISGIESDDMPHVPLYRSQREVILDAIPNLDLPIIIENEATSIEDAKADIDYIKSYLLEKTYGHHQQN